MNRVFDRCRCAALGDATLQQPIHQRHSRLRSVPSSLKYNSAPKAYARCWAPVSTASRLKLVKFISDDREKSGILGTSWVLHELQTAVPVCRRRFRQAASLSCVRACERKMLCCGSGSGCGSGSRGMAAGAGFSMRKAATLLFEHSSRLRR